MPRPRRAPDSPSTTLHRDERGAVLVEFLVALMPLMITFSSFVQLSQIATARVVVKHATIVGARAAAVMSNKNHNTPDQKGDGATDIKEGVNAALGPWVRTMKQVDVEVDDQSSCSDPYGMVSVTVKADYRCSVPFGGFLLCGTSGGKHSIAYKIGFPHEGARFKEGGGAQCP